MSKKLSGYDKRQKRALREKENLKLSSAMKNFVVVNDVSKVQQNSESTSNAKEDHHESQSCSKNMLEDTEISSNVDSDKNTETIVLENPDNVAFNGTPPLNSETPSTLCKVSETNLEVVCDLSPILTENPVTAIFYNSDPALWPDPITDALREYFINNEANQNMNLLETSKKFIGKSERMCCETNFFRKKKNGEIVKRNWLIYSLSSKAVFCYICKLYGTSSFNSSDQALCRDGYSDWRNISKRLSSHENSNFHRNSVYCFSQRSIVDNRIDNNLVDQFMSECEYWKKILYRVVAVVKFISQRGLSCFGDNETVGSFQNGNFLGILELLSLFDPFLAEHIQSTGNKGRGNVNYLSSTIVSEFIDIMSKKVLKEIISEVTEAKYFGIIVDSTPDICHVDQLAIVVRYVNKQGECVERFLKFIAIHGHSSQHLHEVIVNFLESIKVQLKYCRGQSFDNASNMSGKYSGLQARLKKDFPLIDYIPCSAHSLNLVGSSAVECCYQAVSFFGLVQTLYNFFSVSTHRWELLTANFSGFGNLTLKSLSGTRWSANADAIKALKKNYNYVLKTLSLISTSENENAATKHEANVLLSKLKKFESALMTIIWNKILQRIDSVSKTVQSVNCEISAIVPLYTSLIDYINSIRKDFSEYEKEAELLVNTKEYTVSRPKKIPKSKLLDESSSKSVVLSERERFLYDVHYVICDSIITELTKRKSAYVFLESRFGFMCNKAMSNDNIKKNAKEFQNTYPDDIEEEFVEEFFQFNTFTSHLNLADKLKTIKTLNIEHTFPNVETALRIILSMPITNCSSERSFSALKRIKNRLRSSLSQTKLSGLSLLAIENDITDKLKFDDIIDDFANLKARKKPMM